MLCASVRTGTRRQIHSCIYCSPSEFSICHQYGSILSGLFKQKPNAVIMKSTYIYSRIEKFTIVEQLLSHSRSHSLFRSTLQTRWVLFCNLHSDFYQIYHLCAWLFVFIFVRYFFLPCFRWSCSFFFSLTIWIRCWYFFLRVCHLCLVNMVWLQYLWRVKLKFQSSRLQSSKF